MEGRRRRIGSCAVLIGDTIIRERLDPLEPVLDFLAKPLRSCLAFLFWRPSPIRQDRRGPVSFARFFDMVRLDPIDPIAIAGNPIAIAGNPCAVGFDGFHQICLHPPPIHNL